MERIYRKHNDNSTRNIFYFSATTIGWWGILWLLHEVLNNYQAACKGAW